MACNCQEEQSPLRLHILSLLVGSNHAVDWMVVFFLKKSKFTCYFISLWICALLFQTENHSPRQINVDVLCQFCCRKDDDSEVRHINNAWASGISVIYKTKYLPGNDATRGLMKT